VFNVGDKLQNEWLEIIQNIKFRIPLCIQ